MNWFRDNIRYVIAFAGIIVVFLVVGLLTKLNPQESLEQKRELATVEDANGVSSIERVNEYYYETTRGLKRAEKLGLVKEYNLKLPVKDLPLNVTLDKIWYNESGGILFYHVNTTKDVQLSFEVSMPDRELTYVNSSYPGGREPGDGVVYDGNFYGSTGFMNFYGEDHIPFAKIDTIKLENVLLRIEDRDYEVNPATVALDYDANNEVVKHIPINEEIDVNGSKLIVNYVEVGTVRNKLAVSFQPAHPGMKFISMRWNVRSDQEDSFAMYDSSSSRAFNPEEIEFGFPLFNEEPGQLVIHIDGIRFVGDNSISTILKPEEFKEDMSDLTTESSVAREIGDKVGESHNTEVYLNKLVFQPSGMDVEFENKVDSSTEKPYEMLVSGMLNWKRPEFEVPKDVVMGMLVNVVNEKGEEASPGSSYYAGDENHWGFSLDYPYVEKSKEITITVNNLIYEIVGDWELNVNVPK